MEDTDSFYGENTVFLEFYMFWFIKIFYEAHHF